MCFIALTCVILHDSYVGLSKKIFRIELSIDFQNNSFDSKITPLYYINLLGIY